MTARAGSPAPATLRREESRRRTIVFAVALLLLLATSPLLGHHLPLGLEGLLAGRDHLWAVCLVALHVLLAPVHAAFHVLFLAGLAWALHDRLRAWRSGRSALAPVSARAPEPWSPVWRAARAAVVEPERVRVVPGLPAPAFTAGWLRPRIYVAEALPEHLSSAELAAVLTHEAAHLARRDPLRLSILRFLGCLLFWVPAVQRLAADVADEGEVRADDAAAERHGLALASALVRLATWEPQPAAVPGVGFTGGGDLLERRILRLTGEEVPPRTRLTRRSMMGAAFALLLAWASGLAVAHPMPAQHDAHCDGHGPLAVLHLFCRSAVPHIASEHCAHGG